MVSIGTYFVDTVTWEVYLCTNIVGGTYTWTDTGKVRYSINRWFRITKASHSFSSMQAITILTLTTDLSSSLVVDTSGVYEATMRAFNPDFQSKTYGSLKSGSDFDLGLPIIATDYSGNSLLGT